MTTPHWDPTQYLRFADERTRPVHELLARVPTLPGADTPVIHDIGCGPGNSTAAARQRWPHADLTGIDNSPDMLATARTHGEPDAHYLLADARDYDPTPTAPDLILSNATLQWVDGHLDLLSTWAHALKPGAAIAFQVPGNFDAPSHTLLTELRHSPRWNPTLGHDTTPAGTHHPTDYLDTLTAAHCTVDLWETTYYNLLTGPHPVLEWVKGTTLRPVLSRLTGPADRTAFLTEYRTLLDQAYPAGPHGTVFPFRRIFAVATRT
ncbi:methyltransferase domain-containing protein [Kitasatospora sp. NPDC050543]|uniref:methyltransferase domain-containing protein n=1 Tax=Kitasatospora sp. NPDC050543 TaxID=3364054 RepID=UPI0037AD70A0